MDFGSLPPEINSTRIYSGPGSGPMLAAATAWEQLARELDTSAAGYGSVITGLTTTGWQGLSSTMMASAVAPYTAWMHSIAAQAEETAVQAKTAAGAYQTAFAMMVPPPLIAANRAQLTALVAGNYFGQNSPAIAETEIEYDEMWAQDAAAMHSYAMSSSTASRLTPFTDPPRTTDQAGAAAQSAAAAHAGSSPQAATSMQTLSHLSTVPHDPPAAGAPVTPVDALTNSVGSASGAASATSASFSGSSIGTTNNAVGIAAARDVAQGIGPFLAGPSALTSFTAPANVGAAPVSAVMGRATFAGTLSVPQTWAATATPVSLASSAVPGISTPASLAMPGGGMFGESLLGTLAGRGVSNMAAKMRTKVVPRSPSAG